MWVMLNSREHGESRQFIADCASKTGSYQERMQASAKPTKGKIAIKTLLKVLFKKKTPNPLIFYTMLGLMTNSLQMKVHVRPSFT